jgi:hypothetical protein
VQGAALVGVLERRAGGDHRGARLLRGDAPLGAVPEGAPGEALDDQEAHAVVLDVVVDRDDVRVVHPREHARFLEEPAALVLVGTERARELLDGDLAVQPAVGPRQHDAARTPPDLLADVVAVEGLGDQVAVEVHGRRLLIDAPATSDDAPTSVRGSRAAPG